MTIVKCDMTECNNNQNGVCHAQVITVNDQGCEDGWEIDGIWHEEYDDNLTDYYVGGERFGM